MGGPIGTNCGGMVYDNSPMGVVLPPVWCRGGGEEVTVGRWMCGCVIREGGFVGEGTVVTLCW